MEWMVKATPRETDPVPIVEEAGWVPGPVWTGEENLAPPGFDPRTFQPVAIRYTKWAILAPLLHWPTDNKSTNPYFIFHLQLLSYYGFEIQRIDVKNNDKN
jgi:hypothetical protein